MIFHNVVTSDRGQRRNILSYCKEVYYNDVGLILICLMLYVECIKNTREYQNLKRTRFWSEVSLKVR